MSRSYKKCPGFKDNSKWAKNKANRRVRKYRHFLPNGSKYKVLYEQWDITDYNFRIYSHKEANDIDITPYKLIRK